MNKQKTDLALDNSIKCIRADLAVIEANLTDAYRVCGPMADRPGPCQKELAEIRDRLNRMAHAIGSAKCVLREVAG